MATDNLKFNPGLNLFRISQRKIKELLGKLIYLFLILFGLLGIFILVYFTDNQFIDVFYLSLLTDMFLLYLWQSKKERIKKIRLPEEGEELEISLFLNDFARRLLEKSWALAYRKGYSSLKSVHFFYVFSREKEFKKIIKRLNCQPEEVIKKTKGIIEGSSLSENVERKNILGVEIASDFKGIFFDAYLFCLKNRKSQISPLDILWAISQRENVVGMVFDEYGISPEEIEKVIEWAWLEKRIKQAQKSFFWKKIFKPKGKLNRTMTAALTPLLDKFSSDLTYLARQGEFELIIGRNREIEHIFNFFNSGKTGVILVGESEIGKRSILIKLAQMMVKEEVPDFLKDKRLVELDLGSLVSLGTQKSEEYLRRTIFEINRAGNIILVIENADNLSGLKNQASGIDLSEILASSVQRQEIFFIGTSLPANYASHLEGTILGRILSKIDIVLPSREFLWKVLIAKIYLIEKKLKIFYSADALDQAIDLADRYLYGKALPSKAIDLLSEVGYLVAGRKKDNIVRGKDIIEVMSRKTQVPLGQVAQSEKEKLLNLEKLIHRRLINQEEAVEAVASAMRRSRLETKRRKRPIANFLFIGPTGVGKTELSKTLAAVYFGDEKKMIRLDMSEYQEKRGLRRLIGLRTEKGISKGYLTEAIKRQPHSLLLLDEIEKAHPDILNLFLQVMDEGRLTDASGETINFNDIILIGTSNAGTQFIQQKIAQGIEYEEIYRELKEDVLLEHFRPEYLNRFDKIVLFKSLSMENMREITRLFIKGVNRKLEEKGVEIEVEKEALDQLAAMGYDPLYGARPLRRVIQEKVENILAKMFLEDKIKRRDKIIIKKGLVFEIKKALQL